MDNSYVSQLIKLADSERHNYTIAGQNPNISTYEAWYKGTTSEHYRDAIVNGHKTQVKIASSGLAKMGCQEWASNFLNEETKITIPNDKENELLQKILMDNKVFAKLNSFGEKYFALGIGSILVMPSKLTVDEETNEQVPNPDSSVKISYIDGLRVYPITFDDGVLTECAFVKKATNKITIQAHLLNAAGKYDVAEVDGKVSNGEYSPNYESYKIWHTDSETPLFQTWYPNLVDNTDLDNQIGTSILTPNVTEWILAFDIAFDKFITEYKNGGKKRYISSDLVYIDEFGNEKQVPLGDEDVYLPPSKMGEANNMVSEQTSQIRADAFIRGLQFYANMVSKQMGLGDDSFNIDAGGRPLQTATAAMLKKSELKLNVRKNEHLAEDNFKQMCMAIKQVYNSCIQENTFTFEIDDIQIVFEDNLIEDTTSKKEAELKEVSSGVMSIAEFRSHWYDEDYESALKFVQENALMIDKYTNALQMGSISPEMFVNIVYGDVENKQALIDYITEKQQTSVNSFNPFEDETETEEQQEQDAEE